MKKSFFRSKALRLSLVFSGLIAALIIIFVVLFALVIKKNDRKRQSNFLSHTAESVKTILKNAEITKLKREFLQVRLWD